MKVVPVHTPAMARRVLPAERYRSTPNPSTATAAPLPCFRGVNFNLALVQDEQAFAYCQYLSGCNCRWRHPGSAHGIEQGKPCTFRP